MSCITIWVRFDIRGGGRGYLGEGINDEHRQSARDERYMGGKYQPQNTFPNRTYNRLSRMDRDYAPLMLLDVAVLATSLHGRYGSRDWHRVL